MTSHGPSEADLAAVVVRHYADMGYDVYQEVELRAQGIRADIVLRRGPELSIVETKTSPSLALLYQCMERRRFAHYVYAAVGIARNRHDFAHLCKEIGIGLLEVRLGSPGSTWDREGVEELAPSRRWNARPVALAQRLRPEHKTHATAGSPTGGHFSRWRETCEALTRRVRIEPGIHIKAAVQAITHHYSSNRSAVSTMASHIREGRVAGVRIENGALYPTETP